MPSFPRILANLQMGLQGFAIHRSLFRIYLALLMSAFCIAPTILTLRSSFLTNCMLIVYDLILVGTQDLEGEYDAAKAQLEANDTYTQV